MSELIVAGFEDAHTAFLARAALARLQKEIGLNGHDVAVVSREENGEVTVREAIDLNGRRALHEAFWKTLAGRLFAAPPSRFDGDETPSGGLAAIGIDDRFIADVENTVVPGSSALLVLVSETTRDRVLGLLRGFGGKTKRCRLIGEDREQWLDRLAGGHAGETNQEERGA
jgi:uncharacterized membrane protein